MKVFSNFATFFILGITLVLVYFTIPSYNRLGEIHFQSFQYEKAKVYFEKALNVNDKTSLFLEKSGRPGPSVFINLRECFLAQGDLDKAIESQELLIKVLPKNMEELKRLEELYVWNSQPYESLLTKKKRALFYDSELKTMLLTEVLQGLRWLKKHEDANEVAILLQPELKSADERLEYYIATDQYEKVIQTIDRLPAEDRNSFKSLLIKAKSYELLNKNADAFNAYRLAYEKVLPPDKFPKKVNEFTFKKYEAIRDKLIFLAPHSSQDQKILEMFIRFSDYMPNNKSLYYDSQAILKPKNLLESFNSKLSENSHLSDPEIILGLSEYFHKKKNMPRAKKLVDKLVDKNSNSIKWLDKAADYYEFYGFRKEAFRIRKVIRKKLKPRVQSSLDGTLKYGRPFMWTLVAMRGSVSIRLSRYYKNKYKDNLKKLIYLEMNKEKRHKLLVEYVQLVPKDLPLKLDLIYSYMDRGNTKEATALLDDIKSSRAGDITEEINLLGILISLNEYDLAKKRALNIKYSSVPKEMRWSYLNMIEKIHFYYDREPWKKICKKAKAIHEDMDAIFNFAQYELTMRCFEREQNKKEVELAYQRFKKMENSLDVDLVYAYAISSLAENESDLKLPFDIANRAIKEGYPREGEQLNLILKERERLFSSYYQWLVTYGSDNQFLFTNSSMYSFHYLEGKKFFKNYYLGLVGRASKPFYMDPIISEVSFSFGWLNRQSKAVDFELGKNLQEDNGIRLLGRYSFFPNTRLSFTIEGRFNDHLYSVPQFSRELGPTLDSFGLNIYKKWDEDIIEGAAVGRRYNVLKRDNTKDTVYGSILHRKPFKERFQYGYFVSYENVIGNSGFPDLIIPDRTLLATLYGRLHHEGENIFIRERFNLENYSDFENFSEAYLGVSQFESDSGLYLTIYNNSLWDRYTDDQKSIRFGLGRTIVGLIDDTFLQLQYEIRSPF